ncbi:DUF5955 family protein [Streptomyces sp. N2-109]|uniref:DUF5955 family protein n=1 Tax=Streptomyces gossypii TaxID=2883101 RepID=A0ABT2K393_9ACTN|nr:DUF5955 family protein [Streptomyces gossypii]MCT2594094.1 DUF5955 family protein [Streptomyces gossypii]
METAGRRAVAEGGEDPRVTGLRRAVDRVRRELAAHPADLSDRQAAEEELTALDAITCGGIPEVPRLRRSLLVLASALGSVSALGASLAELRQAIELFGEPCRTRR